MLNFIIFSQNIFSSSDFTGYIQAVQEVQESKSTKNLYFDIQLQTEKDKTQSVRVMVQRGESSKRQLFLNKLQTQQPITLSNLQVASSNMVFLNKGTAIQDAPPHSIQFPFQPLAPMTSTSVDTILKNHNSGNFTVSGCIKWIGEPMKPEHATKMVREAELTDPSGTINLSVWDSHMQQIEDKQFYTVTNCKLKQYFGKRLATTVNTAVTKAKEQDISHVEQSHNKQNWVCCPEIMNVYPTVYPVCNNKDCRKKISENPGSKIVHCLHCNRAMLLKNCYIEMNINFHLEKQEQHFSVTAFPKIVGNFLQEDILQYKDTIDDLTEKLLLLENVDFQLSPNNKLVIGMKTHTTSL